MTTQKTLTNLDSLSTSDLSALAALVAETIAARQVPAEMIATEPTTETTKARKSNKRTSGSWEEIKVISGHQYRYLRYWQGGRLRSKYLGKV